MIETKRPEKLTQAEQNSAISEAVTALEADVYLISGNISRDTDESLRQIVSERPQPQGHCVLVLTTSGGDAHAAFLIARFLNRAYDRVTACVLGYCMSAGTLLALGCHEVAMGLKGELGPLDIQLSKKNKFGHSGFGRRIHSTLNLLKEHASDTFAHYYAATIRRSAGQIPVSTAATIASGLTVGLLAPMAEQIDPIQLGQERHAAEIAGAYAKRLGVNEHAIDRLTTRYPDHGFVIDLMKAQQFIPDVRRLDELEQDLEDALDGSTEYARFRNPDSGIVACLNQNSKS